jgi:hypothetical protein
MNGFIDHLCTPLGTTGNYSATANLHTLQITTAPAKLFHPAMPSSAVPWQRLLTVEILQLPALRSYLHSLPCSTQLSTENWQLTPRLTTISHQPPSLLSRDWLSLHWVRESNSELLYDSRFTTNQFVLATSPLRLTASNFIFQLNTCDYSPYVTSSLARGWICHLQFLLVLASAFILRSESRGTHDHILLLQTQDSPNLECQVPVFISPRNRVARLSPPPPGHWVSFSSPPTSRRVTMGGIRSRLHTGLTRSPQLSSR